MSSCIVCSADCMKSACICELPIFIMDHIQLMCCNKSYHVLCIADKTTCLNCKQEFDHQTIKAIKHTERKILEKYQKQQLGEKKRILLRKDINKQVYEILLLRIKKQLEQ